MELDSEYSAVTKKFFQLLKDSGCKTNYQASKKTGISQSTLSEVITEAIKYFNMPQLYSKAKCLLNSCICLPER